MKSHPSTCAIVGYEKKCNVEDDRTPGKSYLEDIRPTLVVISSSMIRTEKYVLRQVVPELRRPYGESSVPFSLEPGHWEEQQSTA